MTGSQSIRHEDSGTIKQMESPPRRVRRFFFLFENERGSFFLAGFVTIKFFTYSGCDTNEPEIWRPVLEDI